jgi:alkylation response protein AidB-like acyl-CoA dehydrogenase
LEFALNSVQTSLQDIVAAYCRENCRFAAREDHIRDWLVSAPRRWKDFAALGLLGVMWPEDDGGSGLTMTDCSVVLHEFGRSLVPEPYWACVVMAGTLIDAASSPLMRRDLLESLIAGDTIFAVGYDDLPGDGASAATTARRQSTGEYVIEGGKRGVAGGPMATSLLVLADAYGPGGEHDGQAWFAIDVVAPEVSRQNFRSIDASLVSDVRFNGVRLAPDARLIDGEAAVEATAKARDTAMVAACAEAVGVSEAILWATRDHLRTRRQFGAALGTMQALQHRMADMFIELEQSRSLLYRALGSLSETPQVRRYTVLAAYLQACRAGDFICRNGVQLHGASGIVDELPIGHYFKRQAVIGQLFGSLDLMRDQFASLVAGFVPAQ